MCRQGTNPPMEIFTKARSTCGMATCAESSMSTPSGQDAGPMISRVLLPQADRMRQILTAWVPVFDSRVDPIELRLRSAAVAISLATGPYRSQEDNWQAETLSIVDAAEALVNQVA